MKQYIYPEKETWQEIIQRPVMDVSSLETKVQGILSEVKEAGDAAVKKFTRQFDRVVVENSGVPAHEIAEAAHLVGEDLREAIGQAKRNIERFHAAQYEKINVIETLPGVRCWRRSVGIQTVGLYVPGGTAPLFSTVLMLAVPAALAGCKDIILCTPPGRDGNIPPAVLFAAGLTGVTRVFSIGGVQAIAAMAFGTATVPKADKIFGPGNQYVTCAKQLVNREGVAIDMPAGPSEVAVLADESCVPAFVAADLLSQAEHGADSQVLLVTTDRNVIRAVGEEMDKQLAALPRKDMAERSLANSKAVLVKEMAEGIALINRYAPEHLIISCRNDEEVGMQIINAGSVFLGNYSPESVGDYASGTNHTLPTNGYARAYSGVSLDSFVKKITYQKLTPEGLERIAPTVEEMASAEGLEGHKRAVSIRRK